jgi:hypothetical protein
VSAPEENCTPLGACVRKRAGVLESYRVTRLLARSELGGALGEMLPLNVATIAPTALESPHDQDNSAGDQYGRQAAL